jgi:trehalose 2-sulfotransferase
MRFTYNISSHERVQREIFGPQMVESSGPTIRCVVIAFVNRSGSNYLGELLNSTGRFAGFGEYLNDFDMRQLASSIGTTSFGDYLRRLERDTAKGGQTWGLKAGWMQLLMLLRTRAVPNVLAPTLVCIKRRDVIGQAISLFIAERTGQWKSTASLLKAKVDYDGSAILAHMRSIMHSYAQLETAVALSGLPCLKVQYEDLLDNPQNVITGLTEKIIGHGFAPDIGAVRTDVQRNELNYSLKQSFMADLGKLEWSAVDA